MVCGAARVSRMCQVPVRSRLVRKNRSHSFAVVDDGTFSLLSTDHRLKITIPLITTILRRS